MQRRFLVGIPVCVTHFSIQQGNQKKRISIKEVNRHTTKKTRIWTAYKDSVYDITDFVDNHPGGKAKIMMAAGQHLDPYWNLYKQHTNQPYVVDDILSSMKIGRLVPGDEYAGQEPNPYIGDPVRDPEALYHSTEPCNAEAIFEDSIDEWLDQWITPSDQWYVRNHHPVPKIELDEAIKIGKMEMRVLDLDTMPQHTIISTMQCGGNRRKEMNRLKKTNGTAWSARAISNAEWKGVRLSTLLNRAYTEQELNAASWVSFESQDGVKISIPMEKALSEEVMIARKMNGEPIPRDHGFPVRLIVPGFVGVRNLKWIKSCWIQDSEVESIWQTGASYKVFEPWVEDLNGILVSRYPSIEAMPVQSAVVAWEKDQVTRVAGYAYCGGGHGIKRVEVSTDGGKTWKLSRLKQGSEQDPDKSWAWTFWEAEIPVEATRVICRAETVTGEVQPVQAPWNIRGLCNNSYHEVSLE